MPSTKLSNGEMLSGASLFSEGHHMSVNYPTFTININTFLLVIFLGSGNGDMMCFWRPGRVIGVVPPMVVVERHMTLDSRLDLNI